MTVFIVVAAATLGVGVWVGLGHPGVGGREDRIVQEGRAKRLGRRGINWLKPERRR